METFTYRLILRFVKGLNVLLMAIPLLVSWLTCYGQDVSLSGWTGAALITMIFMTQYISCGRIYECFLISLVRISEMIYSQFLALMVTDVLMYAVICLLRKELASPWGLLTVFAVQAALSVVWCVLSHQWYFRRFAPKKTVVVYDRNHRVNEMIHDSGLAKKFNITDTVTSEECIGGDFAVLTDTETVFLCGVHSHDRNRILKYCMEKNITMYILPSIGDIIMSGARKMHLFHLPFLRVERYDPSFQYLIGKRIFDVTVSALALLILSPLMLITALAIKLSDGGPVLYRQVRLTKNGKPFKVLKFRSMRPDAEKDGKARLSTGAQDDRVTPVGRIIRKVRIDELPQLFNILGGSMSIVGPRPERPEIAAQYEEELPEFALRLQAKAGLTGYAQVYGKYNTTPYDKLQMDLMYIAHPSFWEDLRIILATVKILFLPESTEGVAAGSITAMDASGEAQKEETTV
ncbi:MAG: sugar transferase [Clostridia bacterium]|nr:sugar transferase [Clostridia bacterium]